jgi:hypothetical protein
MHKETKINQMFVWKYDLFNFIGGILSNAIAHHGRWRAVLHQRSLAQ